MRDRFSTAIYCDGCGRGANEVEHMIAVPPSGEMHHCAECIDRLTGSLALRRIEKREASRHG